MSRRRRWAWRPREVSPDRKGGDRARLVHPAATTFHTTILLSTATREHRGSARPGEQPARPRRRLLPHDYRGRKSSCLTRKVPIGMAARPRLPDQYAEGGSGHLIIMGESLGCAISIQRARRAAGVVLEAPFARSPAGFRDLSLPSLSWCGLATTTWRIRN
jgi:hypothetical protein